MTAEMIAETTAVTAEMIVGMTAAMIAITTEIMKKDSAKDWTKVRMIIEIAASPIQIIPTGIAKETQLTEMVSAEVTRKVIRAEIVVAGGSEGNTVKQCGQPDGMSALRQKGRWLEKSAALFVCEIADSLTACPRSGSCQRLIVYESIKRPSAAMASTVIEFSAT